MLAPFRTLRLWTILLLLTLMACGGETSSGSPAVRMRGVMSPIVFKEQDFVDLAKMNVNAVRWQLNNPAWGVARISSIGEYDRWLDAKLDDLEKALDSGLRNGIKLMIDLHDVPGGRIPTNGTLVMVLEKPYQDHFVKVWQRIATRFKNHPAVWAYDLVNEPVQNTPSPEGLADWLGVQFNAAKAIREIDPNTPIVIEVDAWAGPHRFAQMKPLDISNVIYQAHMYYPGEYTHQGVDQDFNAQQQLSLLPYPGTYQGDNGKLPLNKNTLRSHLKPLRDFQIANNAKIVIGEFSAVRWAPGAGDYLADCISIFEEYGWDWTYHAFREWGGWDFEMADLPYSRTHHAKASEPTARAKILLAQFAKNERFPRP